MVNTMHPLSYFRTGGGPDEGSASRHATAGPWVLNLKGRWFLLVWVMCQVWVGAMSFILTIYRSICEHQVGQFGPICHCIHTDG